MANNTVTVSGMFGSGKTYFADAPVVIDISGLAWPEASPFNVVRVDVVYNGCVVGGFHADTGRQAEISFDVSSALRAIWSDYGFSGEVAAAQAALSPGDGHAIQRENRDYQLRIRTEYISDDGVFAVTECEDEYGNTDIPGGQCLTGGLTERERSAIPSKEAADVSWWEKSGVRYGDASTKPVSSPERVGRNSITSWVDVKEHYTESIFYPATFNDGHGQADDSPASQAVWTGHAPLVLRDSQEYCDFIFVNRRGAVETCSALMLEAMDIGVETKAYTRVERPSFKPSRSLMTLAEGGPRRAWQMSSGAQTREWAEWWITEFLPARRHWMLYDGSYVPVIVEPAKKRTTVYDRAKQQMPGVAFTVTLALEG